MMNYLIQLLICACLLIWKASSSDNSTLILDRPCVSSNNNDEQFIVKGFNSNLNWIESDQFNDIDKSFVLYNETSITIVTKYRSCLTALNCMCAVYIRINKQSEREHAFIDFCDSNLKTNYKSKVEFSLLKGQTDLHTLNCLANGDEPSKTESDKFACSQLTADTYKISTLLNENNVEVTFKFELKGRKELDEVSIMPIDYKDTILVEGLCGEDKYIGDPAAQYLGYLAALANLTYWNLDLSKAVNRFCQSTNQNQFISTYLGKKVNKNEAEISLEKTNYIFYQDDSIKVTTKFRECADEQDLCHCALFIETKSVENTRYVFVDACGANEDLNMKFKYFDNWNYLSALRTGDFPLIDCSALVYDENDPNEWSQVNKTYFDFKCARLYSLSCETYLIEVNVNGQTVRVKVDLKCLNDESDSYLSSIMLYAPQKPVAALGGLCGQTSLTNARPCSLFIQNEDKDECTDDSKALASYWNVENSREKWHLDLSSFIYDSECKIINYERTITKFNNDDLIKNNLMYDVSAPVVLYDHDMEILVYAKYRPCQKTSKVQYCMCSLYIRVNKTNPHVAFVDFCSSTIMDQPVLKFRQYQDVTATPYGFLNCNSQIDEYDDDADWSGVPTSLGYFKCAKLRMPNVPCNKYKIRTVNTPFNIEVQADLNCDDDQENDYLSQTIIRHALKGINYATGLCSDWSRDIINNDDTVKTRNPFARQLIGKNSERQSSLSPEQLIDKNSLRTYQSECFLNGKDEAEFYKYPPTVNPSITRSISCYAQNDPHMKSFRNVYFEFQHPGEHLLYKTEHLLLFATFKKCGDYPYCICGARIMLDYKENHAQSETLLDLCDGHSKTTLKCQPPTIIGTTGFRGTTVINDFFDDYQWYETFHNNRKNLKGRVDCYLKKVGSLEETYFKTMFDQNKPEAISQTLIRLQRQVGSNLISNIYVYPSVRSLSYGFNAGNLPGGLNGGICGVTMAQANANGTHFWHRFNYKFTRVNVFDCEKNYKCLSGEFAYYWSTKGQMQMNELWTRKRLGAELLDHANHTGQITLQEKIDRVFSKRFYQKSLVLQQAKEGGKNVEVARTICEQVIDVADTTFDSALQNKKLELIDMCRIDLAETGDESWAQVHLKSLETFMLEDLMKKQGNFGTDNLIRPDVLSKYGIDCPNKCTGSQNSKSCFRNPKCTFGQTCDYVVKCDCIEPYGSDDCKINLNLPVEFELVDKCFDIRKMDFEEITGVGKEFSNNNTLYYSIRVVVDNVVTRVVRRTVDQVNRNNFRIEYPFGNIPEIQQHSVELILGVGYRLGNYYEQNITVFDSNCRTCRDGILHDKLVDGTCIAKKTNVCSRQITGGACYEPHPCASGFDFAIALQSSTGTSEPDYNKLKHGLSELISRLNIKQNQVHLGLLLNSQVTRAYGSVKVQDQRTSSGFVMKLNDVPYMPYRFSAMSQALLKLRTETFSTKRSSLVARVALIFNDARTNTNENFAQNAKLLKDQGVEVFVVGLNDNVNENELNTLASSSKNVFKFKSVDGVIQELDKITSAICSVNVELQFNKMELIKLGTHDVRYYMVNVSRVRGDLAILEVAELKGRTSVYYSFRVKNPQLEDSEAKASSVKRRFDSQNGYSVDEYVLDVPSNADYVYITLISFNLLSEVNIRVVEF